MNTLPAHATCEHLHAVTNSGERTSEVQPHISVAEVEAQLLLEEGRARIRLMSLAGYCLVGAFVLCLLYTLVMSAIIGFGAAVPTVILTGATGGGILWYFHKPFARMIDSLFQTQTAK